MEIHEIAALQAENERLKQEIDRLEQERSELERDVEQIRETPGIRKFVEALIQERCLPASQFEETVENILLRDNTELVEFAEQGESRYLTQRQLYMNRLAQRSADS